MTAVEYAFAGAAFLTPDPARLLVLDGPEHLKQLLHGDPDELEREYVRLFLSPAGAVCSPWQSAHEPDQALMGEAHRSAAQWFAAYGAAPAASSEPSDHVGLLLTFYAQLLVSGADERDLNAFAERHLSWVPAFAGQVAEVARHPFYRELGRFLALGHVTGRPSRES